MVAKSILATRIAGSILQPRTGVVLNSTRSLNLKELWDEEEEEEEEPTSDF